MTTPERLGVEAGGSSLTVLSSEVASPTLSHPDDVDGAHPVPKIPHIFFLLPHLLGGGSLFVIPNDYSVKFTKSN